MPKQRQTCTRCSQRRQKCDRKSPCTRCVQNGEGRLCTTKWVDGYDPGVHRKYPRKLSSTLTAQSVASSSTNDSPLGTSTSPSSLQSNNQSSHTSHDPATHLPTPGSNQGLSPDSAWPCKIPEISIRAILSGKDQQSQEASYHQGYLKTPLIGTSRDGSVPTGFLSAAARAVEIQHIQLLLPPKVKAMQIIEYYEKNSKVRPAVHANQSFTTVAYWSGGVYHGPSFRKALHDAYGTSDTLVLHGLDWRWVGLLFSILSAGIIGCSEAMSLSWGFTIDDKVRLAREWGAACVSSLNIGNFTSQYHILSVQAIYITHAYEHLVGSTNQWSTLKVVAVAIARGVGLHKLTSHPDDDRVLELNPDQKQAFIEREIGRRLWYLLTSQDWMCATLQSPNIVNIPKRSFNTARPMYLDEQTMKPIIDDTTPTFQHVGVYHFDYAALLLDFHTAMADAENEDDATKYATVVKYDGELRAISAEKMPKCLLPRGVQEPGVPKWVAWARRHNLASVNHKIITLHQGYLNKSFKDARYTYSRWASATAAKGIINMYTTRDLEEPQWWVEQAFIVTGGICLMLDLFHRTEKNDPEAQEYQACVQKAIKYLQQFVTSSVALHGVRMLLSLQQEYAKMLESLRPTTSQVLGTGTALPSIPTPMTDISITEDRRAANNAPLLSSPDVALSNEEAAQFNFDIDAQNFEDLMDYLPVEGGLDNTLLFDSIYGLTNQGNW